MLEKVDNSKDEDGDLYFMKKLFGRKNETELVPHVTKTNKCNLIPAPFPNFCWSSRGNVSSRWGEGVVCRDATLGNFYGVSIAEPNVS